MESEILLEIIEQIKELQSKFKLVNSNIKKLEKQHKKSINNYEKKIKKLEETIEKNKEMKKEMKKERKKSKNNNQKVETDFTIKQILSEEMSKFLNKKTEMSLNEVNKEIINYIKKNNLQNSIKKKTIDLDDNLKNLLLNEKDIIEEVTFSNLNSLLIKHLHS
jgi:chromatin remodeling complex protein RSC6